MRLNYLEESTRPGGENPKACFHDAKQIQYVRTCLHTLTCNWMLTEVWAQWLPRSEVWSVCAACSTPTKLLLLPIFLKPSLLSWYHPRTNCSSVLRPLSHPTVGWPGWDPDHWASIQPSFHSACFISSPCMAVFYRKTSNSQQNSGQKKGKAKSITWLQSPLQRWSQEASQGCTRHSLKNNSKKAPKQDFTSACLLQCYSYLKEYGTDRKTDT